MQITGIEDGLTRWYCQGRPDPYLLRMQSGVAEIQNDAHDTCLLRRQDTRMPIAELVNYAYDVISGPIILSPECLAGLPELYGKGTWKALKHEYGCGDDGLLFTDDNGEAVLDRFGNGMFRHKALDPKDIVRQAVARGVEEKNGSDWKWDPALRHFQQGGDWDGQRLQGCYQFQREFTDSTSVLIGMYFAAKARWRPCA